MYVCFPKQKCSPVYPQPISVKLKVKPYFALPNLYLFYHVISAGRWFLAMRIMWTPQDWLDDTDNWARVSNFCSSRILLLIFLLYEYISFICLCWGSKVVFCFYFSSNEGKATSVLSSHLNSDMLEVDRNKVSVFLSTIHSFMFTCS